MYIYGVLGYLLSREDFRAQAQNWRQVWRNRQRWINGWSNIESLSAASALDPDLSAYASERAVRCVQPIAHAKITRKDVAIVVYHHIGDGKEELVKNLGLSILPETFEKQISYFKTNSDFVGASDLVSGILPRRAVHVTFDDAYGVSFAGRRTSS